MGQICEAILRCGQTWSINNSMCLPIFPVRILPFSSSAGILASSCSTVLIILAFQLLPITSTLQSSSFMNICSALQFNTIKNSLDRTLDLFVLYLVERHLLHTSLHISKCQNPYSPLNPANTEEFISSTPAPFTPLLGVVCLKFSAIPLLTPLP